MNSRADEPRLSPWCAEKITIVLWLPERRYLLVSAGRCTTSDFQEKNSVIPISSKWMGGRQDEERGRTLRIKSWYETGKGLS